MVTLKEVWKQQQVRTEVQLFINSVRTYIVIKQAIEHLEPEIRERVEAMITLYNQPETNTEERSLAMNAIMEALLPDEGASW